MVMLIFKRFGITSLAPQNRHMKLKRFQHGGKIELDQKMGLV